MSDPNRSLPVHDPPWSKRFSKRWLLGRQLGLLDTWPRTNTDRNRDETLNRLNWAIEWHTLAHRQASRWYAGIKSTQIVASAAIPVMTVAGSDSALTRVLVAGLGSLVVALEGIQQLKKYGQNALLWGQGKEALIREFFYFEAAVNPYNLTKEQDRKRVLAERIEQIVGQEVWKWAQGQSQRPDDGDHGRGGTNNPG